MRTVKSPHWNRQNRFKTEEGSIAKYYPRLKGETSAEVWTRRQNFHTEVMALDIMPECLMAHRKCYGHLKESTRIAYETEALRKRNIEEFEHMKIKVDW